MRNLLSMKLPDKTTKRKMTTTIILHHYNIPSTIYSQQKLLKTLTLNQESNRRSNERLLFHKNVNFKVNNKPIIKNRNGSSTPSKSMNLNKQQNYYYNHSSPL
jgi:hypothetical protein